MRLTERIVAHDPPSDADEAARVAATVDEALVNGPALRGALVGIAGTVTTLAAMAQRLPSYDATRVHGSRLSRDQVDGLAAMLGARRSPTRSARPASTPSAPTSSSPAPSSSRA